ncbi:uncharacterized protein BDV17DRAFT_291201 [Aspergillus undulatus]|uniref:uncharacterized protein n=1 Tax=Aspergillus undulatus TaxID=1810928 RepID=UPI003CCDE005
MRNTGLGDTPIAEEPEQLLFNPPPDIGLAPDALDNIPRYLFRIVSPRSDGKTDATWVRSEAAEQNKDSSRQDIFESLDSQKKAVIARTLSKHLWWKKDDVEDNFVSWTSSLLFALQYIYYRHRSWKDRSRLEDIRLYVIDTTRFPRGTFLCDLDLLEVFCEFDVHVNSRQDLNNLRTLRTGGGFYFGEYLSQGSLEIANKHQSIGAVLLFKDNLLHRLQPLFSDIQVPADVKPLWAKEVLDLREKIWPANTPGQLSMQERSRRLGVVWEIVHLFDRGWRFPLAVYFAALIGPEAGGRGDTFLNTSAREMDCLGFSDFHIIAPGTMPELTRAKELVHEVYMYFLAYRASEFVRKAETLIRHLHPRHVSELEGAFPVADTGCNKGILPARTLLERSGDLRAVCEEAVKVYAHDKE